MPKKRLEAPAIETRIFRAPEEIDSAITKLRRRISEAQALDIASAVRTESGAESVVESNIRESIREVFGTNSSEFKEHCHLRMWAGGVYIDMEPGEFIQAKERGRTAVMGVLNGLIGRLQERRDEMGTGEAAPATYFDKLNLHPRIMDVSRDLFLDGHYWEAVFAGAKALVNFVKERSGRHDLDGAALVRAVFSRNDPTLAFNDLSNQTDLDEQEGMMHLFEGAVLAIRNPGGHSFPEGSDQRAMEYISLLSFLAYRVQESKRRKAR